MPRTRVFYYADNMNNVDESHPGNPQRAVYAFVDFSRRTSKSLFFNGLIVFLILISVPLTVLESFSDLPSGLLIFAHTADLVISFIFLIEYFLRLYTAPLEAARYAQPFWGRVRYACTPLMIIDLMAIFPAFVIGSNLLKFLRVFRVLKLARYSDAVNILTRVLQKRRFELLMSVSFVLMLWVWSSFLIYRFEHVAQPLVFQNMLDALWWSAVTFTTVGYGDIYPITWAGRAVAVVTIFLGIAMFSLVTSVLSASIVTEIKKDTNTLFK